MKLIKHIKPLGQKIRSRLPSLLLVATLLAMNTLSAFAQGTGFSSTDLKTGISNSLAVIMMFGFVLGIACVIYGGFAIRRGDVDQGKMVMNSPMATHSPLPLAQPAASSSVRRCITPRRNSPRRLTPPATTKVRATP